MEDVEKVIKKYRLYLIKQANTYKVGEQHKDDLVQCGRIGIMNAYSTFDIEQGSWASWIKTYVKKEMINYINNNIRTVRIPIQILNNKERETYAIENMHSLDDSINDYGESLYQTIAYDDVQDEEDDTQLHFKVLLRHYLPRMKEQWQKILMMRYTEDMTLEEIGIELGITKEAVRQQHTNAIEHLQKLIKTKGTI